MSIFDLKRVYQFLHDWCLMGFRFENLSHQKIVHFSTLTPPLAGIGPKMSMVVFSRGFGH